MARQYSAHSFGLQARCHASCVNRIAFTLEYIACFKLSLCAVRDEHEVTYRGGRRAQPEAVRISSSRLQPSPWGPQAHTP
jgi:hypothetical protein